MGASSEQEHQLPLVSPRYGNGGQQSGEKEEIERCLTACCSALGVVAFFLGVLVVLIMSIRNPPQYFVAIDNASGLNYSAKAPATTDQLPVIDPVFNLTVRIASKSRDEACLHPTTSLHVSYMGVKLAAERVAPGLCAAPWQSKDQLVVARGKAVAMSGFLLDTLSEDVRNGEAVFVVKLMSPPGDHWDVRTCRAKIGDAAALEVPCSLSWVDANKPAV
jgi:hypothetical protein